MGLRISQAAVILWLAGTAVGQAPQPGPPAASPVPFLVPDPKFELTEGGQAVVLQDGTPAGTHSYSLKTLTKHRNAHDQIGVKELIGTGEIVVLNRTTPVLIIKVEKPESSVSVGTTRSLSGFSRSLQRGVLQPPSDPTDSPVEARVISGPAAGKLVYLLPTDIGRLVPPSAPAQPVFPGNPPRRKQRLVTKSLPPRPVAPADAAAASVQLGKNLRFDGKPDVAAEYFRKAIAQAPNSPAADEARKWLRTMGRP